MMDHNTRSQSVGAFFRVLCCAVILAGLMGQRTSMPVFATSYAWSPETNLSNTAVTTSKPSMAAGPDGSVHLVWDQKGAQYASQYTYYTYWNGQNWSTPAFLNRGYTSDQALAVDSQNRLHQVFQTDGGKPFYGYYRIRTDTTWSGAIPLPATNGPNACGFRLVLDSTDRPHVIWQNSADYYGSIPVLYYSYWEDSGWSTPLAIANDIDDTRLVIDNDGYVHIVWRGVNTHKIFYRNGKGANFGEIQTLSEYDSTEPAIAIDEEGTPHVVWSYMGNIIYQYRLDNGEWSASGSINGSYSGRSPSITFDSENHLHALWTTGLGGAYRTDLYHLEITGSLDSATGELVTQNLEATESPTLVLDKNDRLIATWVGTTPALVWQIFTSISSTAAFFSISGNVADIDGNPIEIVNVSDNTGGSVYTDSNGNYQLPRLSPGTYEISAARDGYEFSPNMVEITIFNSDVINQNFLGLPATPPASVPGAVVDEDGKGIEGVVVRLQNGSSVITDVDGKFSFFSLDPGSYDISIEKPGYAFKPRVLHITLTNDPVSPVTLHGWKLTDLPVILIPGITGSYLTNSPCSNSTRPNGLVWPPVQLDDFLDFHITDILHFGDNLETLQLAEDGRSALNTCDHIFPDGIIDYVFFLGDYYRSFIDSTGAIPYAYDWRLSVEDNSDRLNEFIQDQGLDGKPVILVGHSMGGLLARSFISNEERADMVGAVITVGTPYWGAPEAAFKMRSGLALGDGYDKLLIAAFFNAAALKPDLLWNIQRNSPGIMQLLPSRAYFDQSVFTGYYYDNGTLIVGYQETTDYFIAEDQNDSLLNAATDFHDNLDDFRENNGVNPLYKVPYFILAASHLPTVTHVSETTIAGGLAYYEPLRYQVGDQTVPYLSASLTGKAGDWSGTAEVCTLTGAKNSHGQLMVDASVKSTIQHILQYGALPAGGCVETASSKTGPLMSPLAGSEHLLQVNVIGQAKVWVENSSGQKIGPEADLIINNIPGSTYDSYGIGTILSLPAGDPYNIRISPQTELPIYLRITDFSADESTLSYNPIQRAVFVKLPSAKDGIIATSIDLANGLESLTAEVDKDGDGVADIEFQPSGVINGETLSDLIPPQTSGVIEGTQDQDGYYSGQVSVSLSAKDEGGSGIKEIAYSIDGGLTWEKYLSPIIIQAQTDLELRARAVDNAGNLEMTGPILTILVRPQNDSQVFIPIIMR